jgi:hypothetical protein
MPDLHIENFPIFLHNALEADDEKKIFFCMSFEEKDYRNVLCVWDMEPKCIHT